jgi:hypothetical protein
MFWKTKTEGCGHERGDIQHKWVFAWWPRKCSDGFTRWLETVTVKQVFTDMWCPPGIEGRWREIDCYPKNHFSTESRKLASSDFEGPGQSLKNLSRPRNPRRDDCRLHRVSDPIPPKK